MEELPHYPGAAPPFSVGEIVQLRRSVGSAEMGAAVKIVGFYRRDADTIAVEVSRGVVIEVRPEDLDRVNAG
jgi:hypothetical protein